MAELVRPGVEVIQTARRTSPSFVRPALVPCVIGAAFEVIKVLNTDGTINSKAKYGTYAQLGETITQSSFPDHRGNIAELDIQEDSIRTYMLQGGSLSELVMGPGQAFLAASHKATKAAMKTAVFGASGLALNGKVLVLAVDQSVRIDTSEDITITFSGSGNLTATQAADQINTAVGRTIATVEGTSPNEVVVLASPTFGALSSLTVRAGGSANTVLELGFSSGSGGHEERVEGAGFRGQDDSDNDTLTPWIEFHRGGYILDGAAAADGVADRMGFYSLEAQDTFATTRAAAVTFGSAGTLPIVAGDYVYADGLRVKSGEIMKVESTRFKVGTINTALSVANDKGQYTTKVYDVAEVGTELDSNPFAPKYVYFVANGLDPDTVAPVAAAVTGSVAGTAATAASVEGGALTDASAFPLALAGLKLHYIVTVDGVETDGEFTFTGGPFADMSAVVAAIGSNIAGVIASAEVPGVGTSSLKLATSATGRLQGITIVSDGTANASLGFSTSADTSGTGTDVEFAGLTGQILEFTMNNNPHIYAVTFTSDSLDIAIDDINELVGTTVASKSGGISLKLTSTLKGAASQVLVATGDAATTLGLAITAANGSGRPLPNAYLDDINNLVIGSEILRDSVTGHPLDQLTDTGTLYIQFTALRKDVSASAEVAGVLRIPDVDTLTAVLDPVTEENPLALGMFLCLLNAPNMEIKGLGIDEVTASAPEGTEVAWARAIGMLEAEEVYALAPLTHSETVHGVISTHVVAMSEPEQAGERIAFINKKAPTRKNPAIAASGTQANSTATSNQLLLDVNPSSGLVAAGLNPALGFDVDDGVYIEVTVDDEFRRYSVSSVSGSLVNLRTSFASGENTDGFYSTVTMDSTVVNSAWALKVLGDSLVIPGSNPARYDYSLMADTVSAANATLKNRRLFSVYPDTVKAVINGVEKTLPGYYSCAAIAGMVAAQPPQQGFTNFPVTGLTGVVGPEKFSKKQLNVMAGGGTYILVQETVGGAVTCRHQVSTDLTSIEHRELSITKVVDYVAKFLRTGVRKFIGTEAINEGLLDTIGTTVQGMLAFLVEAGVLVGAELNNLIQDEDQPDTLLLDITLDVPYPCNYIRLTLAV